jgi:hypothetical protein
MKRLFLLFTICAMVVIASTAFAEPYEVPLQRQGGILVVPVLINNQITLDFVLDSGAADVSIPADVFSTLLRTRTVTSADFLGRQTYVLADGTTVPSQVFRIRSLKVGNRVVDNVTASVSSVQGQLLLGQSFLTRFRSWSIDNNRQVLVLDAPATSTVATTPNVPESKFVECSAPRLRVQHMYTTDAVCQSVGGTTIRKGFVSKTCTDKEQGYTYTVTNGSCRRGDSEVN